MKNRPCLLLALLLFLIPSISFGQSMKWQGRPLNPNYIIPQAPHFRPHRPLPVQVSSVEARVEVRETVASTFLVIHLSNPGSRAQEAEILLPVPEKAAVSDFSYDGMKKGARAEVLPKDQARDIYQRIVAAQRDPALLEFAGLNLIRTSVFPVPARGTQRVELRYDLVLSTTGERVDYVLPRSESLDYNVPWDITVNIQTKQSLGTVYSPTHELDVKTHETNRFKANVTRKQLDQPGPFRLSWMVGTSGVSGTLFAYPESGTKGGYFLFLAGTPRRGPKDKSKRISRDVVLVLDRSGSMSGEKISQVKRAVEQVLAGLRPGETFNIITYNQWVDVFSEKPVEKNDKTVAQALAWVDEARPLGGTNIHGALTSALAMESPKGSLPLVLFLTDGLPTVGITAESKIRELGVSSNPSHKRIFTFGVGVDVNTPLLESLARESRARPTFVLPKEDVELAVARVFAGLDGPVLASPVVSVEDVSGHPVPQRLREVLPRELPDLFSDDQVVVLGRYVGDAPVTFVLSGTDGEENRRFKFSFDFSTASLGNTFVPRLWAIRQIAHLIDAIRRSGADVRYSADLEKIRNDPRFKELVEEVVRLSQEFGVLTEYTAFLATDGTVDTPPREVQRQTSKNFVNRAVSVRSGMGSVNQSVNLQKDATRKTLNPRNAHYDSNMESVSVTNVQQVANRAFYRTQKGWVDGRILAREQSVQPVRKVVYGSAEFLKLLWILASKGQAGWLSLGADTILEIGGEVIQVTAPNNNR